MLSGMARIRYDRLPTERSNPRSRALDRLKPGAIARLMNRADLDALRAVGRAAPAIGRAVGAIVERLGSGGRLIFVGAGTSGRLGVIEAAECPPTFDTLPGQVQAVMAGGRRAVFRSVEGAEDDARAGAREIRQRARRGDAVVGIAASGVTPFVRAALGQAPRPRRAPGRRAGASERGESATAPRSGGRQHQGCYRDGAAPRHRGRGAARPASGGRFPRARRGDLARIVREGAPTLTPALSLSEGEGAISIPSLPEGRGSG